MVCLGILWNSMEDKVQEALNDICLYGEIKKIFSLELGNDYERFVRDIYLQDEIAEWKVDKKVETMFKCSSSRKVTIVLIDIETKEILFHDLKKRNVYVNLENMKTDIRKKYSQRVEYYFFDNIFHVTDDEKEFKSDLEVVNNYIDKGIKTEFIDLPRIKVKSLKKENNNGIKK